MHAFAHVTGGGLAANLARVLPPERTRSLDRGTWRPPPVFGLVAARGEVPPEQMERTFNMGVGMAAVVAAPAPTGRWPAGQRAAYRRGCSARSCPAQEPPA